MESMVSLNRFLNLVDVFKKLYAISVKFSRLSRRQISKYSCAKIDLHFDFIFHKLFEIITPPSVMLSDTQGEKGDIKRGRDEGPHSH